MAALPPNKADTLDVPASSSRDCSKIKSELETTPMSPGKLTTAVPLSASDGPNLDIDVQGTSQALNTASEKGAEEAGDRSSEYELVRGRTLRRASLSQRRRRSPSLSRSEGEGKD